MLSAKLDTAQVLYYLGHKGQPVTPQLRHQLDACCEKVLQAAAPKWQLRRFPLGDDLQPQNAELTLLGEDIRRHLAGCHELVVMAATLGPAVETLLMRTGLRDMADAAMMDAAASCAIEAVCDDLEADLRRQLEEQGLYLTGRFSPGYGDLPISLQSKLLLLTDAERQMGLTVTTSGLLVPRKSVTALLGISKTPVADRPDPCAACALRDTCQKRKERIFCGR